MNDPIDDVVNALNLQVKEETINRYLRERLILEEELKEYQEERTAVQKLTEEIADIHHQLGCLLVGSDNLKHFWELLGFPRPPLPTPESSEAYGAPACPIHMTPRGFFKKSRYVDLVYQMYESIAEKVTDCRKKTKYINELTKVINQDIDRFHLNYDLLSILAFLKSLDAASEFRKKILGSNFTSTELGEMEKNMAFRKLKTDQDPPANCPDLPSMVDVRRMTSGFLGGIFIKEKEEVLPALNKSRVFNPGNDVEENHDAES